MTKDTGSYRLDYVTTKSTYLRHAAVKSFADRPGEDHHSMEVAWAPGIAVTVPAGSAGAEPQPPDIFLEAARRLHDLLPDYRPPADQHRREVAEVNGKLALVPSADAQRWLGGWGRGTKLQVHYCIDARGRRYLALSLDENQVLEPGEHPAELRTPLQVVRYDRRCTQCADGCMVATGAQDDGGQHAHRCEACGCVEHFEHQYPRHVYEHDTRR